MSQRVFLIICDSLGIGHAPDAEAFGDLGANTLEALYKVRKQEEKTLHIPFLEKLGLKELQNKEILTSHQAFQLEELSQGKDTTTGHWEIAGNIIEKAFPSFPKGFPEDFMNTWLQENNLAGYLHNNVASGASIINELGDKHCHSKKPIVYTSVDSVFQIACHEEIYSVPELYQLCKSARKLLDPLGIGRVIARPFIGSNGNYHRTKNRKDFSLEPPKPNLLDLLVENKIQTASVGKLDDIFNHRSIHIPRHTANNADSYEAMLSLEKETRQKNSFLFINLIDFDQNFGHRRNPSGYASCLEEFDSFLTKQLIPQLGEDDLLLISGDHGNDPSFRGTDHTRERVPLLLYKKNSQFQIPQKDILQKSFAFISNIILDYFQLQSSKEKLFQNKITFENSLADFERKVSP